MRNSVFAEKLLARAVDPTRAAAIYGDLLELAATRGRLWFIATYTRTLISLTWRTPVAFLGGLVVFNAVIGPLFHIWMRNTPHVWRSPSTAQLLTHTGTGLELVVLPLWFAMPYTLIRYGVRDRFARLLCVVSLGTTVALMFVPCLSMVCAVATSLLVARSLLSGSWRWRAPMVALFAALSVGSASLTCSDILHRMVLARHHRVALWVAVQFATVLAMFALAFVISRLHRWLLEPPASPTDAHPMGGAHA